MSSNCQLFMIEPRKLAIIANSEIDKENMELKFKLEQLQKELRTSTKLVKDIEKAQEDLEMQSDEYSNNLLLGAAF
ncbi:hypothetical protein FRC11_007580 [Ceratobasidium sp. 423]|nr:hypothetical protein FRC11_007580 [Ceratobasidium sp. 423]